MTGLNPYSKEAELLKDQGINIIIALGHSGYLRDQEIAAKCSEVDLVIGGHSHSFLYNGSPPDAEHIEGPYPTVVNQTSGKQVPVVQAYAFTKYLGKLHVQVRFCCWRRKVNHFMILNISHHSLTRMATL